MRARVALVSGEWMNALDLASQALSEDSSQTEAAQIVGTARRRLGTTPAAGAELRQLTVMAVDMARSTALAATVSPETWRELMMELYGICADAVTRFDGRVTKYVGDGVLAHFGHPVAREDDARRATLASFAVLEGVELLAARWADRFGEPVVVRIGIDTGTVAVGPVHDSPWSTDEISGDAPNIASRVQTTADSMTIRVTDSTHRLIGGWFETERVGDVELRNFPRPIGLHRVIRPTEAETRLEASLRARPPLVNREAELRVLRAAWSHVQATGERRVVTLTGEAGIGKSRLVEHVLASAVAGGASPITLACSPLQRDSPLRPVVRALRRRFHVSAQSGGGDEVVLNAIRRQLEQLPNRRVPIEQAVPICAWLLGVHTAVDMQPDALRRQLFEAVIDLFEALAIAAPIVLYVDDVDHADPSTVELVTALLARPAVPMLVILTGRGPLPVVGHVDDELRLTGLGTDHAAELARAVAPSLATDTVARIVTRCDGLPFYLEELSRAAEETQVEVLAETVELSAFVSARLDELGPELRQLVGQIAIAGHEVRVDVLARLADAAPDALRVQIDELTRRGVVRRSRGPVGEVVRFRHGVMREAAYKVLLETRRRALHTRLAGILVAMPGGVVRPEDLAGHYALAGDHGNAARWWLAAGGAAAASGSNREAIQVFGYCLSELVHLPKDADRLGAELQAQLGLGSALLTTEGYTSPNARGAFERAAELAEGFADSTVIFPALWGIWTYWFVLGEHGNAEVLAARCLAIAEQESADERFRWAAAAILGYGHLYAGDFEDARRELELASRAVGAEPVAELPHDMGIVSQAALAVALLFLGDREASISASAEAFAQAEALDPTGRGTTLTRCWVANWVAWRAEIDGDPATALQMAQRAADIGAQHGFGTWSAAAALHRSIAQCSLGQYEEGLPMLTAMVDAWQSAGRDGDGRQLHSVLMTSYYAGRLAEALLATGDRERAARWVDELLAATAANGEHFWDAELLRLRAEIDGAPSDTA